MQKLPCNPPSKVCLSTIHTITGHVQYCSNLFSSLMLIYHDNVYMV